MAAGAKISVKLMTVLIGIPVGLATKQLVEKTWKFARPDEPARNASDTNAKWADAVGWAALSAAGIVIADLVSRRSAAVAYELITGNEAPPSKPTKGVKKLEKAEDKSPAVADPD